MRVVLAETLCYDSSGWMSGGQGCTLYNSKRWREYAKEKGFELNPCTPDHNRANGIVERFMGVLGKTVHAANTAGKDVPTEVQRKLLNYRNTPHPSTGKTPSEMIMLTRTKPKIPSLRKVAEPDSKGSQAEGR